MTVEFQFSIDLNDVFIKQNIENVSLICINKH